MPGVPRDTRRRIGLLGGSFNPAHGGHRHISLEALKRLDLDEVWWLVSPQNPLKPRDGMAPLAERLRGARRDRRRHPRIRVTDSSCRLGTSATRRHGRALRRRFPRTALRLADGWRHPAPDPRWQRWRELFRAVPIAAFARPGSYCLRWPRRPRALSRRARSGRRRRGAGRHAPPAWCFFPSRLDSHSATAIRAVRPRHSERKDHLRSALTTTASRTLPEPPSGRRRGCSRIVAILGRRQGRGHRRHRPRGQILVRRLHGDRLGRSNRQVVAIAEHLADRLQAGPASRSKASRCDWVLIDAGDVVVHLFRPEPRLLRAGKDVGARARGRKPKPAKTVRARRVKKPAWIRFIPSFGRAAAGPNAIHEHYAGRIAGRPRCASSRRSASCRRRSDLARGRAAAGRRSGKRCWWRSTAAARSGQRGPCPAAGALARPVSDVAFLIGGADGHGDPC